MFSATNNQPQKDQPTARASVSYKMKLYAAGGGTSSSMILEQLMWRRCRYGSVVISRSTAD
jgi:hypothetical protein